MHMCAHGVCRIQTASSIEGLTNTAGFLSRPLVVLLTGDVLLPDQLKGRQTLKVQSVSVTETCPLPFAIRWDSRISTTALVNFCVGRNKMVSYCKKGNISVEYTVQMKTSLYYLVP